MTLTRRLNWSLLAQRGAAGAFFFFLFAYAVWPWLPGVRDLQVRTVVVYGFSILGEVMNEAILPAFEAEWEAQTGENVEFISAFASSGTITNQIILGAPAEVAIVSLELDALRMQRAGVVPGPAWRSLPFMGVVNTTPFVILTRTGNPLAVRDFADLTVPGVGIVHPDPLTSGGAQWAVLAEYGSRLRQDGDAEAAFDQLLGIWENVVAQSSSARAARTQFENGFGDVLVTYEQEALRDRFFGRFAGEIVYPASTILSEHTVVVIERNIPEGDAELVRAFVAFLWSDKAQQIFVDFGFRSMDPQRNAAAGFFGEIADPFTVGDLGGWQAAGPEIIENVWKARVLPELGN